MRKKRSRFSKEMLSRFEREERGQGVKDDYSPWHQIKRSEPSSKGQSSRSILANRFAHLLSRVELSCFLFATMNENVIDIREQFPLNKEPGEHELNEYTNIYGYFYPGTINISEELKVKHPRLRDESKELWTMTTDILITLRFGVDLKLIAISCKKSISDSKRQRELLSIEKILGI